MSDPSSPTNIEADSTSDSGYASAFGGDRTTKRAHLFIPSPQNLTREETHAYHVTTRNYFAYVFSKPLVGEHLGTAMVRLWRRIQAWQPRTARLSKFLEYCKGQGYLHFTENPRYALAMLCFSEEVHVRDTWIDAFTHCVGMYHRLGRITETEPLSHTTKALMSHAAFELDMHIVRLTRMIGDFLEDELGAENLGLTKLARDHLDRFRSFLHSFYVEKRGYFPPNPRDRWDKHLWVGMYYDFQNLYEYLADTESSNDRSSNRGVNGGICVLQNVHAFDERHGYTSLPHPLPLLPELPIRRRTTDSQRGFRNFKLGRSETWPESHTSSGLPAVSACNSENTEVMKNSLVRAYIRFEREKLEEKITVAEARKVRWLLVYCTMQMLVSMIQAPKEVQETEAPSYPLCVTTEDCPPWDDDAVPSEEPTGSHLRCSAEMEYVRRTLEMDRMSIHPDCEADNAEEYFAQNGLSRSGSDHNSSMMPNPLRIGTQLSRRASKSTVQTVQSIHRSVVGSLSRRNSVRQSNASSNIASPSGAPPLPETYIDFGGSRQLTRQPSFLDTEHSPDYEIGPQIPTETHNVPLIEDHQLAPLNTNFEHYDVAANSPSNRSTFSSHPSVSNRSVSVDGDARSPISDLSSWDGRQCDDEDDDDKLAAFDFDFAGGSADASPLRHYNPQPHENFPTHHDIYKPKSVNAGCYVPSGAAADTLDSYRPHLRTQSTESVQSVSSSTSSSYPEDSQQADEIEEEETRGRRRWRALDRLPGFGAIGSAMNLLTIRVDGH